MPPDAIAARPRLYTSAPATPPDARLAKSNERDAGALAPSPRNEVGIWRPLTVTRLNSGPKPRTVTSDPSPRDRRSEEHTSELQSLMRISYAVFCLKKTNKTIKTQTSTNKKPSTTHNHKYHHPTR